jgi:hypothetical protein
MQVTLPPHSKISYPSVSNKEFKWESGSDVQALWKKHGWLPPSEKMTPPPPEKFQDQFRRYK